MQLFESLIDTMAGTDDSYGAAFTLLVVGTLYGFYRMVRSIDTESIKLWRAAIDMAATVVVMFTAGVVFAKTSHASEVYGVSYTIGLWLAAFGVVLTIMPLGAAVRDRFRTRRTSVRRNRTPARERTHYTTAHV